MPGRPRRFPPACSRGRASITAPTQEEQPGAVAAAAIDADELVVVGWMDAPHFIDREADGAVAVARDRDDAEESWAPENVRVGAWASDGPRAQVDSSLSAKRPLAL
jgi:hypothetical protein